jgi:hypothetical protein
MILRDGATDEVKGRIKSINIRAEEIETDSVKLNYIVPFELGNLRVEIDSLMFNVNEYTQANLNGFDYDLKKGELVMDGLSLGFDRSWIEVSQTLGVQNDVIDFDLEKLTITGMEYYSSVMGDLDIEARRMSLEGLDLRVQRNKNFNRPPDVEKPMFKGMIDLVPFVLIIDTIDVIDSKVSYSELSKGKETPGTINVSKINGQIVDLNTAQDEKDDVETLKSSFTAKVNEVAPMNIDLSVPYDEEAFDLNVELSFERLKRLNSSLVPLVGAEIYTGHIHRLNFSMEATRYSARNKLIMDYDSLTLTVLKEGGEAVDKERTLMTGLANIVVRTNNLPDTKHYRTAEYQSERNIYRAPFQFIVQGIMEGVMQITPIKPVLTIMNSGKNNEKKSHRAKKQKKRKN